MHGFWKNTDPQAKQMEMVQFLKDTALCGGSLMLAGLFWALGEELGRVIVGPLFTG
jgi:putative oxidoreductase